MKFEYYCYYEVLIASYLLQLNFQDLFFFFFFFFFLHSFRLNSPTTILLEGSLVLTLKTKPIESSKT